MSAPELPGPAPEQPNGPAHAPFPEPVERALARLEAGEAWSAAKPELFDAIATAGLDPVELERALRRAATATGSTLEAVRTAWREALAAGEDAADDLPGRPLELEAPEPWPEVTPLAGVLDEAARAVRAHVRMTAEQADAVALWAAFAHVLDRFTIAPRLAVTSPTKRCGKSTLLEVVSLIVPKPILASSATAAALFRAIDQYSPTVLLDEVDQYLADDNDMRAVINSAHRRSVAWVLRAVKVDNDIVTRKFSTWAPMVLAGIGTLPDTIADRSITVRLERRDRRDPPDRLDDAARDRLAILARKFARWARDRGSHPFPTVAWLAPLHDRANDNWAVLRAIAAEAGGSWPARASGAAVALTPGEEDSRSLAELLLGDVRAIFAEAGDPKWIASEAICEHLAKLEHRPWPEASHGKPITPRRLATLLGRFGIGPSRSEDGRVRVWKRADLAPLWARYLTDELASPPPCSEPSAEASSRQKRNDFNDLDETRSVSGPSPSDTLRNGPSPCEERKSGDLTLRFTVPKDRAGPDASDLLADPPADPPAPLPDGRPFRADGTDATDANSPGSFPAQRRTIVRGRL